ncbi:MAG: hypothetical protein FWE37_03330 [Spirochaetaceae bacterium]|nr:hypothetical protein [Spirochaetaceae bacterium]
MNKKFIAILFLIIVSATWANAQGRWTRVYQSSDGTMRIILEASNNEGTRGNATVIAVRNNSHFLEGAGPFLSSTFGIFIDWVAPPPARAILNAIRVREFVEDEINRLVSSAMYGEFTVNVNTGQLTLNLVRGTGEFSELASQPAQQLIFNFGPQERINGTLTTMTITRDGQTWRRI